MKQQEEVGFVESVRGPVAYVSGLPTLQMAELIESESGAKGFVGALRENLAEVFLLSGGGVKAKEAFRRTGEILTVPVGDFLLGRAISPLGNPVDEGPAFAKASAGQRASLYEPAVGISGRRFITEQFDTGISAVDTIFPMGKGQRELIIGEQRSGKTGFLLDVITNLGSKNVVCVYALIGKPVAEVRDVWRELNEKKLSANTVLVVAKATDPAPLTFLAAPAAMSIATFFQKKGRDVLVILDDMGVQARTYREMALISNRPPGRESYPGDIFYQQARLLERAGCFNATAGGGSITALPVIELMLPELSAFIPTNLMGMTDGHLLFSSSLSQQGQRPAIDLTLSVTRVGSQTQKRIQNLLATKIKEVLARGTQMEAVSRFGSELATQTKALIIQKQQIEELLKQKSGVNLPKEMQTVFLALPFTSFLQGKDVAFVKTHKDQIETALLTDLEIVKLCKQAFEKTELSQLYKAIEEMKPKLEVCIK